MSIALITMSTKMRNGVYCSVINKTKYILDILCTVIFSKLTQQPFSIFLIKLFYYYECKLQNIYKNTCAFVFLWWNQRQPPKVFYKKAFLKNFTISTGKHLCWSLFLKKLFHISGMPSGLTPKEVPTQGVFLWLLRNF